MEKKKVRGLALSGGGSHGSFQTGVLKALREKGTVGWDVVSGVSVGSINTACINMFNKEQASEAIETLIKLWDTEIQGNKSIYKPWYFYPFNYIASLWKGSLNHTGPLEVLLQKNLAMQKVQESNVDGFVGAVSLNSGEFRHESLKRSKDPIKWILASSAMPIIFEPIEIEKQKWTDGGVRSVTPVKELLSLKEYEFEHIDIIMADPPDINYTNSKFTSILDVAKRSLECSINEIMITDIETMGFKGTVSIYFPNSPLPFEAFSFKPEEMKLGIEIGYKETLEKLNK